jgi:LuxR family maltose regulon positive regulatory protein
MDLVIPILRTKIHRPAAGADHIHRSSLLARLNRHRHRPLTLVSAPAGYGKSTLLSCWLESSDISSAWVSLDENDNDLHVFLSYFLAAVQTQFPGACSDTMALLNSISLPPVLQLTHSLVNELDQIGSSFILVLDDYHVISDQTIHVLIAELLQHPPEPLHLVLSSRVDPLLPLARFRARGQMSEIRVRDLRFSLEETGTFLEKLIGARVDDSVVATLEEKTEGWVTGLRLVALSLQRRQDLNRMIENLPAESRYVADYLLAEVLSNQPEDNLEYLLATAILERFCAPLCDALCVPGSKLGECKSGGQQFLNWLENSGLFVIRLDEQGHWFRYHNLFQQLLQRRLKERLGPDEISALRMQASRWFAENNLIDEALQYALAAGEVSTAAQLVEQNRHAPLNQDKWYVLEKWLSQLPDDIVQQRPELLLARAWVMNFQFALWDIPPLLAAAGTLLAEESNPLIEGEIDLFNGIFSLWEGHGERSMTLLRRALERIPLANVGARNEAEIYLAGALQIAGHGKTAVQTYRKKFYNERSVGTRKMRLLGALIFIHLLSGELVEADEATRQLKDMTTRNKDVYIAAWASYLGGIIHYQWNNLQTAAQHFTSAVENSFALDTYSDIDSFAGLALSCQAMQQSDKVDQTIDRMLEFAQASGSPGFLYRVRSVQARLRLLQGDLKMPVRWLETNDFLLDTGTMFFWLEVPRITQCRVLLARGSEAGLDEALDKLQEHLQFNRATHNTPQAIEILVLQAMVHHKQGRIDEALAVLEQAVTLARPGGYVRPFVNLGKPMAKLLTRLLLHGKDNDYIERILAAFDANETVDVRTKPLPLTKQQPRVRNQALENPLTNRELEILALLGQGLQNKEIAVRLFISPGTVKKHTRSIYRKLDAHNRRQAVAQAYQLGVLTSSE